MVKPGDLPSTAQRGAPPMALVLSVLALSIPLVGTYFFPERTTQDYGLLVWLLALVPPFLLSYYRGWRGASTALAGAMAVYTLAQLLVIRSGTPMPSSVVLLGATTALILVSLGAGTLSSLFKKRLQAAEDLALTDAATGLPNRRFAMLHLARGFAAARRGDDLSVVLFDVDGLRQVNERWGHGVGDEVLQLFARILSTETRDMHLSARLGGGEFLAVLDEIDIDGAERFAEKVLGALREQDVPWGELSASAGIATYEPEMQSEEVLVATAEQALYRAKAQGRDQTVALERADSEGRVDRSTPIQPRHSALRAPGSGETVLVVDDDVSTLRVVVRMLRRAGYRTLSASTPEQAESLAKESLGGLDLLVTDVVMPGMDGFRLAERILDGRSLPVLYFSGYDRSEIRWQKVPGDPKAFLGKPINMRDFLAEIRALLEQAVQPSN